MWADAGKLFSRNGFQQALGEGGGGDIIAESLEQGPAGQTLGQTLRHHSEIAQRCLLGAISEQVSPVGRRSRRELAKIRLSGHWRWLAARGLLSLRPVSPQCALLLRGRNSRWPLRMAQVLVSNEVAGDILGAASSASQRLFRTAWTSATRARPMLRCG